MKNKNVDKSPVIPQRSKIRNALNIRERQYTEKQKEFLKLAFDKNTKIIFVTGPAGTGKTYLSVYAALKMLSDKRLSDLIYIRSAVESSENRLGFLPGEVDEKMNPYIQPLMDKLDELDRKSTRLNSSH